MPAWTAEELTEVAAMEPEQFRAMYPHRSRAAIASQRNRLHLQGVPVLNHPRRVNVEAAVAPVVEQQRALLEMHRQADRNLGMTGATEREEIEVPEDEVSLERMFSAYKEVRNAANDLPGPARQTHWYAPDSLPTGICFIGDVHAGGNIEYELFERDLSLIRDTEGLHAVAMGDLIDNFKPQAKSGTGLYYALFGNPDLQVAYITVRMRWIRSKLIALCGGNHEGFDGRWAGIDRLPALARDLGTVYFTEAGGSVFAHVGDHRYHLVCKHDYTGKSRINRGNSARRLWDEWSWSFENADAVVLAHLHEPHLEQPIRKGQQVVYLRSGTYKIHDEWAESRGYRPTYGVPMVVLYPDSRRIIPFHGEHYLEGVRFLQAERARYLDGSR